MNALVLAQKINKEGRHDATGAFVPGAKQFAALHGTPPPVWLNDVDDRNKMINAIQSRRGLEAIAYFGHGHGSGLGSAEIGMRDIPKLAEAISQAAAPGCRVILYACTAGRVGGFAQKLAESLGGRVVVFGHSCLGHSFTNPFVTRYPYYQEDTQPFLIDPQTKLFPKWRKCIKGAGSDIWARFPFMPKWVVEREVETGVRVPVQPVWAYQRLKNVVGLGL